MTTSFCYSENASLLLLQAVGFPLGEINARKSLLILFLLLILKLFFLNSGGLALGLHFFSFSDFFGLLSFFLFSLLLLNRLEVVMLIDACAAGTVTALSLIAFSTASA